MLNAGRQPPIRCVSLLAVGACLVGMTATLAFAPPPQRHAGGPTATGTGNTCSEAAVVRLVTSLVAAFNSGNAFGVDRLVAKAPSVPWFAVPGRNPTADRMGNDSMNRSTLTAFVRERHRHHARWAVAQIQGNLGFVA